MAQTSVPLRNAIKSVACGQTSVPFRTKDPVAKSCVHLCKFIIPSAVAVLVVSLLQRQNDNKTESEEERARRLM